jgi:hypothetical protein
MTEKNFLALRGVQTPEIQVELLEKQTVFAGGSKYIDADDELLQIANWIKSNTEHNKDIKPERIKYLYTTNVKKDGGRYVLGNLSLRTDVEKMVNDEYDYILFIHYKSWKELDIENKVIQLDKILCGVDIDIDNKTKKYPADSKEYTSNLRCYGEAKVLNSSEMIDTVVERITNQEKEERKNKKENIKEQRDEVPVIPESQI